MIDKIRIKMPCLEILSQKKFWWQLLTKANKSREISKIFFMQYFFRPVFGRFCVKSAAVRPPNCPGRFCVILQNFWPAGNSVSLSLTLFLYRGRASQPERQPLDQLRLLQPTRLMAASSAADRLSLHGGWTKKWNLFYKVLLKGPWHEIFDLWFFSSNNSP
jgi:hypothetical protein